jgi:hypothetical protein
MDPDLEGMKRRKSLVELLQFAILNVGKPSGPTSFKTTDLAKRILRPRKSCHYGTLDAKVSGVLPTSSRPRSSAKPTAPAPVSTAADEMPERPQARAPAAHGLERRP